jgi:hypothetical protein
VLSRIGLSVVVCSLALAGCQRSIEKQVVTPATISEALPSITDMPGDWDETQRQVFDERGPENPSIDPSVWCPAAADLGDELVVLAGQSGADVEMQAESASGSPRMMRLQAWTNGDVDEYFDTAEEAALRCDGATITDPNGTIETMSIIDGREIGDESVSWEQTVTPPPGLQGDKFQTVGRTTIARFGSIVMVLQLGDAAWTGDVVPLDEDEWWAIVELAGRRLASLGS